MQQLMLPECVYSDLNKFISNYYCKHLPHPLLIAQEFCLRYPEHGEKFSLSTIANSVDNIINNKNNKNNNKNNNNNNTNNNISSSN
jgi:hypothetical protein